MNFAHGTSYGAHKPINILIKDHLYALTMILECFHLVSLLSTLSRLTQLAMFLQQ